MTMSIISGFRSRAGVAHLEQTVVKVEPPKIYETNMLGSHQVGVGEFLLLTNLIKEPGTKMLTHTMINGTIQLKGQLFGGIFF